MPRAFKLVKQHIFFWPSSTTDTVKNSSFDHLDARFPQTGDEYFLYWRYTNNSLFRYRCTRLIFLKTRSPIGNFIGAESPDNAERLFFARSNHPPDFFDNHLVTELRTLKCPTARVQGRTSLPPKFEFPTTPTPPA